MSTNSKIEWTDATWNVTIGCDRVSAGCDGCYAIRQARMRASNPNPKVAAAFAGTVHHDGERLDWTGTVNLLPERLGQPLRWRKPKRIFVDSLSDLFHADVPDDFIARVFATMAMAPQHVFQVLTKRPARMRSLLGRESWRDQVAGHVDELIGDGDTPGHIGHVELRERWWPLRNVWCGVSVEDQKTAQLRIPILLDTPAWVRWLSCEPLLGPLDLDAADRDALCDGGIDWIVCGGESGPGARPMHPRWAESIAEQCLNANVPLLFKQWGDWATAPNPTHYVTMDGGLHDLDASGIGALEPVGVRRLGKGAAGRELDGRTWDAFPEVAW